MLVLLGLVTTLGATPLRVAAPDLECSGVEPAVCSAYLERLASQLQSPEVTVVTARDIAAVLGAERQRQLLGCAHDGSSCLTELAGALGVDAILTGTVVRGYGNWIVTLKVVSARDARTLATLSERPRSEPAVQDFIDSAAAELRGHLLARSSTPPYRWLPVGLGIAALAAGVALFAWSKADASQLRAQPMLVNAADLASRGRTNEILGLVLGSVGLAAIAAGAAWLALGPEVNATVAPVAGGGGVVIGGRW